jgi:hypothetical protein
MALQRVTLRLTQLRCITQSESGGSEPYLWVTYFALGAQPLPFQTGLIATITPAYDAFRTEFADNVKAGDVLSVPPFLAEASFDIDPTVEHNLVGCAAVLMEEDETPQSSIVLGRIAYAKEIDKQLNEFVNQRLHAGDFGPITDDEIKAIQGAVAAKVYEAIGSNQSIWNLFTNQDDKVGFTYRVFQTHRDEQTGELVIEIVDTQAFDFPEIVSDDSSNRFVLSGGLFVEPVPADPVDACALERAALKAKKQEIDSLRTRLTRLQDELHHATPQQKPAIVAEIETTSASIAEAEAELPGLQNALDVCLEHHTHHGQVDVSSVLVNPG